MDVGPPVFLIHGLLCHEVIFRLAGRGVNRIEADHAADLKIRIDLETLFDSDCRGDQLVVGGLVHELFCIFPAVQEDAAFLQDMVLDRIGLIVDLVKCHPIRDFILVALEAYSREMDEHIDRLSVQEPVVFFDDCPGQFKMAQRDKRLDVVLPKLIEQVIIEFESFFIRLCLVASGENSGPGNRGTESFEAHLGKQGNVFFIVVIKISRFVVRIILSRKNAVCDPARLVRSADSHDIRNRNSFSAYIISAFNLMSGSSSAPHKIFSHSTLPRVMVVKFKTALYIVIIQKRAG